VGEVCWAHRRASSAAGELDLRLGFRVAHAEERQEDYKPSQVRSQIRPARGTMNATDERGTRTILRPSLPARTAK
jgi:hypothetical protein